MSESKKGENLHTKLFMALKPHVCEKREGKHEKHKLKHSSQVITC